MSSNRPRKTRQLSLDFGDEPNIEDFGIATEEYHKIAKGHNPWNTPLQVVVFVIALITGIAVGATSGELTNGIGIGFLILVVLGIFAVIISEQLKRRNPVYRKAILYEQALESFNQRKHDYWTSLKGARLEDIVGDLYGKLGYKVKYTPRTDDKGIDLILKKDDRTTIVQCKGYRNPVGPAIVRELYGTLTSSSAESAILVSPAGFTRGARQTAAGKNIQLISSVDLIKMVDNI